MPSESREQQKFFGLVRAVKKGTVSPSSVSESVRRAAQNVSSSDAKEFASSLKRDNNFSEKDRPSIKKAHRQVKVIGS